MNECAGNAKEQGKASLTKAITWATTDAAGPGLPLLRTALLDLASIYIAEQAVPAAAACLQAAAVAGRCLEQLLRAPQALGPVTASAVPTWAAELLQGMPFTTVMVAILETAHAAQSNAEPDSKVCTERTVSCMRVGPGSASASASELKAQQGGSRVQTTSQQCALCWHDRCFVVSCPATHSHSWLYCRANLQLHRPSSCFGYPWGISETYSLTCRPGSSICSEATVHDCYKQS